MSDGSDLTQFLLDCLTAEEQTAQEATPGPWRVNDVDNPEWLENDEGTAPISGGRWGGEAPIFERDADAHHIVRYDPVRALSEIKAKRRIVEECMAARNREPGESAEWAEYSWEGLERACQILAQIYADQPGFHSEWLEDGGFDAS